MHAPFPTLLALTGLQAAAFPSMLLGGGMGDDRRVERLEEMAAGMEPRQVLGGNGPGRFDAQQQLVSTTGNHRFIAPGPDDQRGLCPGLNAMANHNYIPRNGVATVAQFIEGTYQVFGMAVDLSTFLAVFGAVTSGDLLSWSISGPPRTWSLVGGLLGAPQGIANSHNKYEADTSPTRGDLYQYGDASALQLSQFRELYTEPPGVNGIDITTMARFHVRRFRESKDNNPYFLHGVFALIFSSATFNFIYRFMGNKSAEYPQGYLDRDVLKSFFAVTAEPDNFQYNRGHERIPTNWYKRAIGDEYGIASLAADMTAAALTYPELLSLGANQGRVNTFAGVDIGNLTGGVYNLQNLVQGNNAACLAFQLVLQALPDVVKGLYSPISLPLVRLNGVLGNAIDGLSCPQLQNVDMDQLRQFPVTKSAS